MGWLFRKIFKLILFLLVFPWLYGLALNVFNPPITITQINSIIEGYGYDRQNLSSEKIPKYAQWALVAAEDQKFALHNGFDLEGIQQVLEENIKSNNDQNRMRGASTISQQTAKNVYLWQGRSWFRKALEAYCTFALETTLSKKRILEIYLNIAEMGKGVFGIEAAAQYYYNKSATQLTETEISRIISALPSPKKYNVNPPSDYIVQRGNWVQRQVRNLKGDPDLTGIIENNLISE